MILRSIVPRRTWGLAVAAVAAGLVGGACAAALIALINSALHRADLSRTLLLGAFAGLMAAKIGSQALARLLLDRFTQRTLMYLCRDLTRQVLATPLRRLEDVGIPRIFATLTDDVAMLGWAAQNVPVLAMNAAVLAGCSIYLGWLSWSTLLAVLAVVVAGAVTYRVLIVRAYRYLQEARDTRDVLFQHFRALTEGMKELKLHAPRRQAFFSERIESATEALSRASLGGLKHHLVADTWSQLLFYGLIGGLLFGGPAQQSQSAERVTGYILVTLYMMGPVWGIIEALPTFARARISLQKVRDLGLSLATSERAPALVAARPAPSSWRRLDFDAVTFAYPSDVDGQAFELGPLDVTFQSGEIVFLVGGNGSGKSTFVKVLTGLYDAQAGAIRLDGVAITPDNREWYCQHFSAVFSDFYLFDTLLGLDPAGLDARAQRFLVELELDAKLQIVDGALSTTALSQGQRKRLALLTAFLEDRPIYVFDEWAADQDPHYREIFYRNLLPDLKARGKTVFVISHDDRYYHLGDRVVKLEYGKMVEDRRPLTELSQK
ncbi:MAG: cyclic peptide export ABC transporter [Candidatus Rokuibacteriota bacterium]